MFGGPDLPQIAEARALIANLVFEVQDPSSDGTATGSSLFGDTLSSTIRWTEIEGAAEIDSSLLE